MRVKFALQKSFGMAANKSEPPEFFSELSGFSRIIKVVIDGDSTILSLIGGGHGNHSPFWWKF